MRSRGVTLLLALLPLTARAHPRTAPDPTPPHGSGGDDRLAGGAWVSARAPVQPASIKKVHVIQSCHLDVGFSDLAIVIVNRCPPLPWHTPQAAAAPPAPSNPRTCATGSSTDTPRCPVRRL
eukprot:COSAG04_NODE_3645_length_2642_cov_1.444750_1_plen_122_part_00